MAIGIAGNPRLGPIVSAAGSTSEQEASLTPDFAQYVALALPERANLVANGQSFVIGNTTGYDSVSSVPTTAGKFDMYNGESGATAKSYIIDKVVVGQNVVDATQSNCSQVLFCLNKVTVTIPTAIACKHVCLSASKVQANATTGTLSKLVVGTGTTITNNGWFPLPIRDDASVTAVAGATFKTLAADINGLIIIPPGGLMSLALLQLAAVTAASFFNVYYHEVPLSLS